MRKCEEMFHVILKNIFTWVLHKTFRDMAGKSWRESSLDRILLFRSWACCEFLWKNELHSCCPAAAVSLVVIVVIVVVVGVFTMFALRQVLCRYLCSIQLYVGFSLYTKYTICTTLPQSLRRQCEIITYSPPPPCAIKSLKMNSNCRTACIMPLV